MKSQKGFSLIEVLIVVMIMAVLATLSAQTIQQSSRVKVKLQKGIDQQSAVRSALAIIERDVNLAFHYRDLNFEIESDLKKKKIAKANQTGQQLSEEEMAPLEPPPKVTQFIGEGTSMRFTSLSNVRMAPDAQESDQSEIIYEITGCKSAFQPNDSMQCLFRSTSPILDTNFEEGANSTAVLENVTKFQLRYFGEGKDDWVDTWKSDSGGDDVTKDKFPEAVEILIETEKDGKKFSMVTVAQIRLTNNQPIKAATPTGNPNEPAPTGR